MESKTMTVEQAMAIIAQICANFHGTLKDHQTIQQALAIYQGDFLPSAPLSAAQWADARRSYLRQRFLDLLEEHARALEDTAPDQAIQHYQRILQIDSCREQTAVQLMRLALRVGNHLLLVETFNHLAGALRALGLSPEPSTRALLNSRAPGKTAMPQASA